MLINLSNHPSKQWSRYQLSAAQQYGMIRDIPFPVIDPYWDEEKISDLADQYFDVIAQYPDVTVMVQGEFTFSFSLVCRLLKAGIPVLAACSERRTITRISKNGVVEKTSCFSFVRFRKYERTEA